MALRWRGGRAGLRLGLVLGFLGSAVPSRAEVVRVEVLSRTPFAEGQAFGAVGAYEKVSGRLHYSVDPNHPANARIVDLKRAPLDAGGRVTFAGDFILLKPVELAKGNHRLLYDVNNRGGLPILSRLNRAEGSNDPPWARCQSSCTPSPLRSTGPGPRPSSTPT